MNIPVTISSTKYDLKSFGTFTKYIVKDNKIPVGYVDLKDTPNGIRVEFIKNQNPELYSGFGKLADMIEVQHCINRGFEDSFEITSEAALNSHAKHYLRGKRFKNNKYNEEVRAIIENTPKGEKYNTKSLGAIEMYMPKELIKKYKEILKKIPLFK